MHGIIRVRQFTISESIICTPNSLRMSSGVLDLIHYL